jgi:DNA-binding NtrC family response regulator
MARQRARELDNLIERAVTLARGSVVDLDALQSRSMAVIPDEAGVTPTLAEIEYDYLQRVLTQTNGDKRAAARILGVSVRTIQRKTPGPKRWLPDTA